MWEVLMRVYVCVRVCVCVSSCFPLDQIRAAAPAFSGPDAPRQRRVALHDESVAARLCHWFQRRWPTQRSLARRRRVSGPKLCLLLFLFFFLYIFNISVVVFSIRLSYSV